MEKNLIHGKSFHNEDKTLQEFINNYSEEFGCNVNMVLYKSTILFMPFVNKSNLNKKLSEIFHNKFNLNLKVSPVILTIDCMEEIELPPIEISL